jgi:hypothetical protein
MKTPVEFADIEKSLRANNNNVHLIGLEKEIEDTQTIVDLQGRTGRKYVVGFYLGEKPRRAKATASWPKSPEENLERLKDAGLVMNAHKIKCDRCNGESIGHPG